MEFTVYLVLLSIACLASFIFSYRKRKTELVLLVPLITLSGSLLYYSYKDVLGYPTESTWEEMPEQFTVIYFRAYQEKITLWVIEGDSNKLIELPPSKEAHEALEMARDIMGRGTPVTFEKSEKENGRDGDEGNSGGEQGSGQYNYRVLSEGQPIPGHKMIEKEN